MDARPFRFFRNIGRSREIISVLVRYGFADLVDRLHLRRYLQWGRRLFSFRKPPPEVRRSRAERIRLSLESLGATFIKFGQVLSTRPDLVPADVVAELAQLQEQVPSFPYDLVRELIRQGLGAEIEDLFAEFDPEPLAAGSLGQVHRARAMDGALLAVKIRRPQVVQTVERDLSLMQELAALIERHIPEAEVFDPVGLVKQFARTIRREMNYTREARTMDEFQRLFRNDATLSVPQVHWDLSCESILSMEFIDGYRVDETEELARLGISRADVAANGAAIFMKQAFELGVFHGDPHPGNIRVLDDGSICLLDYGMVGAIDDEQRERLIDLFMAIARRDVKRAVELIQKIGEPFRPIDRTLLQADVRDFVENYYGLTLDRLNVGNVLSDFVNIMAIHGIRCPSDLMLLIRALVTLEGVGRDLDPAFNFAELLAPFIERTIRERYSPTRIAGRVFSEFQTFARVAHDMPIHIGRTIEKLSRDELKIQLEHRRLEHLITEVDRSSNRVVVSVVMASLILSSALVMDNGRTGAIIAGTVFVLSSMLGIWLIYGVFRSGRL